MLQFGAIIKPADISSNQINLLILLSVISGPGVIDMLFHFQNLDLHQKNTLLLQYCWCGVELDRIVEGSISN